MSEFIDLSVIGLDRIYNGQEKLVNLINPKNLNIDVEYFDKESNIIKAPVEVGEYTVVVKSDDMKITKKLVIKKKEEVMSNFNLSESEIQNLVIDAVEPIVEESIVDSKTSEESSIVDSKTSEESIVDSKTIVEEQISNKTKFNNVLLRLL